MDDEIKIEKTTIYSFVGLVIMLLVGGYMVFGAASVPSDISNSVADSQTTQSLPVVSQSQQAQDVYIKAKADGTYDKSEVVVKSGNLVRIHFTTEPYVGCGAVLYIYGLNLQTVSKNGQEGIIEFTPTKPGTYEYNCGMRMWSPGKLIVQ
ncbi:MAG: cupredoxin domain-containing protein [Candidatus Micrarchaeota archaeon]